MIGLKQAGVSDKTMQAMLEVSEMTNAPLKPVGGAVPGTAALAKAPAPSSANAEVTVELASTPSLQAQSRSNQPAPECMLTCDFQALAAVFGVSCEADGGGPFKQRASTDYGTGPPAWRRLKIDRTNEANGRTYTFRGVIVSDPVLDKPKYYFSATGGQFGAVIHVCKSDGAIGSGAALLVSPKGDLILAEKPTRAVATPATYTPSIVVPACQQAQQQGALSGDTYLCMESQKGDSIGQGKTWIHTPGKASIAAEYLWPAESAVRVKVTEANKDWNLVFGGGSGKTWMAGLYLNATAYFPFAEDPSFEISGHGQGCSKLTGRFEILELVYDGTEVKRFAVNFEQRCENRGPALLGVLRFNSALGQAKAGEKKAAAPVEKVDQAKAGGKKAAAPELRPAAHLKEMQTYDEYGRPGSSVLEDDAGKVLARAKWLFNAYNPTQISGREIYDVRTGATFKTEYDEFGKPVKSTFFCLDKSGGMLIKSGKPVLVQSFNASQQTEFQNVYNGAFIAKRVNTYQPCTNCAAQTGIPDCAFVW